jgi:hypothetical protein
MISPKPANHPNLHTEVDYRQWLLDPENVSSENAFHEVVVPPVFDYPPLGDYVRDLHDDRRVISLHASGLLMLFGLENPTPNQHLRSMDIENAKQRTSLYVRSLVRDYVAVNAKPRDAGTVMPDPHSFGVARNYLDALYLGLRRPMDKRMTVPRIIAVEQRLYSRNGVDQFVGNTTLVRHFVEGHLAFLLDRVLPGAEEKS